jgi:hypothetical protein
MAKRKLKNTALFLPPAIAVARLVTTAMESIMWQRFGTRVRWTLKVEYFHDENFKAGPDQRAVSLGFTASSGNPLPIELERILTGHTRPAKPGACQYCGCTEGQACEGGCAWIDESQTVCSNPECVEKHNAESTTEEKL